MRRSVAVDRSLCVGQVAVGRCRSLPVGCCGLVAWEDCYITLCGFDALCWASDLITMSVSNSRSVVMSWWL